MSSWRWRRAARAEVSFRWQFLFHWKLSWQLQQFFCSQTSASECVLVTMLAARAQAIKTLKQKHPFVEEGHLLSKLMAYCSKEAHSCVEKAAMISFVKLRILEPDSKCSLRGDTVTKVNSTWIPIDWIRFDFLIEFPRFPQSAVFDFNSTNWTSRRRLTSNLTIKTNNFSSTQLARSSLSTIFIHRRWKKTSSRGWFRSLCRPLWAQRVHARLTISMRLDKQFKSFQTFGFMSTLLTLEILSSAPS